MLVKANWTGKDEYHQSKREAFWAYNEVISSEYVDKCTTVKHGIKNNPKICSKMYSI